MSRHIIEKPSINDKVCWLLRHNKNYTKEQMYTLDDLHDQIKQLRDELEHIVYHAYNRNTIGYTKIAIRLIEGED